MCFSQAEPAALGRRREVTRPVVHIQAPRGVLESHSRPTKPETRAGTQKSVLNKPCRGLAVCMLRFEAKVSLWSTQEQDQTVTQAKLALDAVSCLPGYPEELSGFHAAGVSWLLPDTVSIPPYTRGSGKISA